MTAILVSLAAVGLGASPQNPVLLQLLQEGIPTEADALVKISAPTMTDGLDAAAQGELIARVAGPKRRVADLLRNSVVAPFVLQIGQAPTPEGQTRVRTVDVWFVAYGRLEQFTSEEFLEKLAEISGSDEKSRLPVTKGLLTDQEMRRLNLSWKDTQNHKERYCYSTFALFERVLISATRRVVVTRHPDSVVIAAIVDPRFSHDSDYPNRWRSLKRDELGKYTLGPPQPYVSAGFYAKVTKLEQPPGALFIEHHHVFSEPQGWFQGRNLLRSKLPLVIQDGVRKLRRKLRQPTTRPG